MIYTLAGKIVILFTFQMIFEKKKEQNRRRQRKKINISKHFETREKDHSKGTHTIENACTSVKCTIGTV